MKVSFVSNSKDDSGLFINVLTLSLLLSFERKKISYFIPTPLTLETEKIGHILFVGISSVYF
jgi:hypothetical protein